MGLTKYKIGDLISVVDERNNLGIREFYGINISKEFMPTAANTEGLDESKYKVIRENRFVFSGMQTGRDECIRISMYTKNKPILVSPAYMTFEVTATELVLPMYFFLCFLSHEKDRLGAFLSDGSIRSNLDLLWSSFFVTFVAKNFWIVAWSLSELPAFVNGASHRCAAMPLTKPAISDFGRSSNPTMG